MKARILIALCITCAVIDVAEAGVYWQRCHANDRVGGVSSTDGGATYDVTELPTGGGSTSVVYHGGGINATGDVVTSVDSAAYVWPASTRRPTRLSSAPGHDGEMALSINNAGDVVGYENGGNNTDAVVWRKGSCNLLPSMREMPSGEAWGVNSHDVVVGRIFNSSFKGEWWAQPSRAVVWRDGTLSVLALPKGSLQSRAYAINDNGDVVGWVLTSDNRMEACVWSGRTPNPLGTLAGGKVSKASFINNNGQIVGDSDAADGLLHTVMWWNGKMIDLGLPPHRRFCMPTSINNRGQVLGDTDGMRQFVWDAAHGMRLIDVPDGSHAKLLRSIAISDNGDIVAAGMSADREEPYDHRLFVLTPVDAAKG